MINGHSALKQRKYFFVPDQGEEEEGDDEDGNAEDEEEEGEDEDGHAGEAADDQDKRCQDHWHVQPVDHQPEKNYLKLDNL